MSAQVQLDMFQETTQEDLLRADLAELAQSHHAVRKKLFGQVSALSKMVIDQQQELDYLKVKLGLACPLEKPR